MGRLTEFLGHMTRGLGPGLFAIGVLVLLFIPLAWLMSPGFTAAQWFLRTWDIALLGGGLVTVGALLIRSAYGSD